MQAIAFYLPQYHPIPENDAVYGPGFTEWDNVRNARPLFPGHYQPHVPHNLTGYYNLLDENFLERQHKLAWEFGVNSFCYYYYNMNGRPLLEKPLKLINNNPNIRNGFCLCWAHLNWYNNRDPQKAVFLEQVYSQENAALIIKDMAQYLENPRYIKIDGKPFITVFAPERNPLMKEYARIWRDKAAKMGYPGVWLGGVQAYAACKPEDLGLDSMIEFAPHWHEDALLSTPGEKPRRMDYAEVLAKAVKRFSNPRPVNRCAFPSWDNTARRGVEALLAVNTSPELYRAHLEYLCEYTKNCLPANLQYVFINAWNEWGEGCHLEPDKKHGLVYLEITRDVLKKYQ